MKCLHKCYRKEPFSTLKMLLQLSWLTIAMNFVEVFIVIGRMLLFFCAYSMFFSKFRDGYMRDSMEYLKTIEWRSRNRLEIWFMLTTLKSMREPMKIFLILWRYKNTKIVCSISKNYVKLANRGRNAFDLRNLRELSTNNYVKAQFLVVKDTILRRQRHITSICSLINCWLKSKIISNVGCYQ